MSSNHQRYLALISPLIAVILYSTIVVFPSVHNLHIFLRMVDFYSMPVFIMWLLTGSLVLPIYLLREARRPQPRKLARYFADLAKTAANPAIQITSLTPPLVFIALMSAFGMFKQAAIPTTGYWAGPFILQFEYHLLGGHHAWEITHALLATGASFFLDQVYQFWFILMAGSMLVCSYLSGDPLHRCRFMLCFIATWLINGSVIAYLVPAAGPIYFHDFHPGPDPFATLKAQLAADDQAIRLYFGSGLFSLQGQSLLLDALKTGQMMPGGGISAMPSMHNAVAILLACAGFSVHRVMGWALSIFALLIFVGSVHLGWHYALDGVVAGIVSYGLWASSGTLLHRHERRLGGRRSHRQDGRRATDLQSSLA